ncbi:MAG: nucleotidyltransferase domain-containing protein [Thermodesulfobacteriota bacterium]
MRRKRSSIERPANNAQKLAGNNNFALGPKELGFLKEFKRRLLSSYPNRIKQVSLFGSRATGSAKEMSDYDVFVMVDRKEKHITDGIFDLAYEIYAASDLSVDISPVIMSEEYYRNRLSQERRIAMDIETQGIAL